MIKRLTFGILLACLAGALAFTPAGRAQDGTQPIAQFLEITPVKHDIVVDRGGSQTVEATITNRHVSRIRLKTQFDNLVATDDDGNTRPVSEPTPWDLRRFVTTGAGELDLAPRESRKVSVTVTIPADTAPGGYYGILRFIPINRADLPQVAIQGQIGELFLVRVPGPTKEEGNIKDFLVTSPEGKSSGGFYFGNDLFFLTRIHNGGNVHFATAPKIRAKDQFGKTVHEASLDARNVFPQGDRKFESRWENARTGWYTATVTTSVPGQPETSKTIKVLVVTPVFALLAGGVLLVLVVILLSRRRRRRRDKVTI